MAPSIEEGEEEAIMTSDPWGNVCHSKYMYVKTSSGCSSETTAAALPGEFAIIKIHTYIQVHKYTCDWQEFPLICSTDYTLTQYCPAMFTHTAVCPQSTTVASNRNTSFSLSVSQSTGHVTCHTVSVPLPLL